MITTEMPNSSDSLELCLKCLDIIAKRPVETGRRRGGHVDLLVQMDVFGHHLTQGIGVHGLDESLHVHAEFLRWLGLGADVGQIQTVAANHSPRQNFLDVGGEFI